MIPACAADYRALARRRLPHFLFDYIDGGAFGEATLRRNEQDLQAVELRQRILAAVPAVDLAVHLFGRRWSMPVGLGPVGIAGMSARRGEAQAARAAADAGVPFILSTVGTCSLAEVAEASPAPVWLQLYMVRDRAFMADLLAHAREMGCPALIFTVDVPVPSPRYRDVRSGFVGRTGPLAGLPRALQALARPRWLWDVGLRGRPHTLGNLARTVGAKATFSALLGWVGRNYDPGIGWEALDFLRAHWSGPIILKGVLDPQDARDARAAGVDGLIVSNHGGRQLDGALSTARALPAIADAVGDDLPVLVDGGVRSGLDVARMLALGARAVLLGRLWNYALASHGEAGVRHMLRLIEAELRTALTLCGIDSATRITRDCLASAGLDAAIEDHLSKGAGQ